MLTKCPVYESVYIVNVSVYIGGFKGMKTFSLNQLPIKNIMLTKIVLSTINT